MAKHAWNSNVPPGRRAINGNANCCWSEPSNVWAEWTNESKLALTKHLVPFAVGPHQIDSWNNFHPWRQLIATRTWIDDMSRSLQGGLRQVQVAFSINHG